MTVQIWALHFTWRGVRFHAALSDLGGDYLHEGVRREGDAQPEWREAFPRGDLGSADPAEYLRGIASAVSGAPLAEWEDIQESYARA